MAEPGSFTLVPEALVEIPEPSRYFLKLRGGRAGHEHTTLMKLDLLQKKQPFKDFLANRLGYLTDDHEEIRSTLTSKVPTLPHVIGTSRLGWTPQHGAFIYGRNVYPVARTGQPYEFLAPEGTLMTEAAAAFSPRGSLEEQYKGFRELWQREPSWPFRLVLALAAVSPILEIANAPCIVFHLAGSTGIGKTTLLRLGVAVYADPNSPLTFVDFGKDTMNYADSQFGLVHNFPLCLDETTLGDPAQLGEVAYHIATGRTKGRLTGPEQEYLPAATLTYTLVCFLSGEHPIREDLGHRGATARIIEIAVEEPVIPQHEIPRWRHFADAHHGWFGRDVVRRWIKSTQRPDGVAWQYAACRRLADDRWPGEHSRTLDFLACVQLGYRLAGATVLNADPGHKAAEQFAHEVYGRLNKATKLDLVLDAIVETIEPKWVERGFIPRELLMKDMTAADGVTVVGEVVDLPVARELGLAKPADFLKFLRDQGMVTGTESRKVAGLASPVPGVAPLPDRSVRCFILTAEGKKRLAVRVAGRGRTTP